MKFIDYIDGWGETIQNCVMVDSGRKKLAIVEKCDMLLTGDEVYNLASMQFPDLNIRGYFDSDVTEITSKWLQELGGYIFLKEKAIHSICGGDLQFLKGKKFFQDTDAYGKGKFTKSWDADSGLSMEAEGKYLTVDIGITCSVFGEHKFATVDIGKTINDVCYYAINSYAISDEDIKKEINEILKNQ